MNPFPSFALKTGILYYLVAFFLPALAQENLPVQNFPNTVYKAHHQNWSLSQSTDNIMYAGNSDGMLEYDGAQWRVYTLPNRQIARVVYADGDRIYTGGYGEFGYWQKMPDGHLIYKSLSAESTHNSINTEEIWHILKTPDAILFQSFSYIYRYDLTQNRTEHKIPLIAEIRAPGNFMFLQYADHRILVQLIENGIYEMQDNKFTLLPGTEILSSASVSGILSCGKDSLLIATAKDGLFIYSHGTLKEWIIPLSERLKRNLLNKITLLKNGSYAIGTLLSGLYIIDNNGNQLHHFNKFNGLQNNSVLGMYEDNQNNLWLALDKGIDRISIYSPVSVYKNDPLELETTYAITQYGDQLYVGSNLGVFRKKWPSDEPFTLIPGLQGQVWDLKVFDNQLICGHNEGTFLINGQKIRKISSQQGGWNAIAVQSANEKYLIQGTYTGLSLYKKDHNGEWAFIRKMDKVPPVPVKYLALDQYDNLWVAHAYKGLYKAKLNKVTAEIVRWEEIAAPEAIPEASNVEITELNGYVSIRSGHQFFTPGPNGTLLQDQVLRTSSDNPYKIRNGVEGEWFKVYRDHILLEHPGQRPVLIHRTLVRNYENIIPVNDRYYFFCADNGYFVYDRSQPIKEQPEVSSLIRKVNNLHNAHETFAVSSSATLPSYVRDLRISYALPFFGNEIKYRYRLKGLSDNWSEWTQQTYADFTNLPSGHFGFELQNTYNHETLVYQFELLPRWFEARWVGVSLLLLIFLLVAWLLYWQEKRMKKQQMKLIREHEEKLRQKELANEKRIMEIRNEQLTSEVINKSQQLSNIAINVVRKNEILEEIRSELIQVKRDLGQQLPTLHYQKLLDSINRNVSGKEDWKLFEDNFTEVHEEFFKRLKALHPSISPGELRLAAALRMNLSSKEIAPILGISIRGVEIKRYRLRKKLGLTEDYNLSEYMMDI